MRAEAVDNGVILSTDQQAVELFGRPQEGVRREGQRWQDKIVAVLGGWIPTERSSEPTAVRRRFACKGSLSVFWRDHRAVSVPEKSSWGGARAAAMWWTGEYWLVR